MVRAICSPIASLHRIFNGECDPDLGEHRSWVRNAIIKNCNWQARIIRIVRDKWRKRIEFHFYRQGVILESNVRQWILPGKGRRFQPAQTRSIV
jgi:hypothetical protein